MNAVAQELKEVLVLSSENSDSECCSPLQGQGRDSSKRIWLQCFKWTVLHSLLIWHLISPRGRYEMTDDTLSQRNRENGFFAWVLFPFFIHPQHQKRTVKATVNPERGSEAPTVESLNLLLCLESILSECAVRGRRRTGAGEKATAASGRSGGAGER